jgi:nitrate/TMAO reductase-like tetraheme cytochrome c subunit
LVDFNAAQNPGHIENNFSMECLDCHNNNSWEPADFDHSNTQFTLNGAHIGVSCAGCHFGNYTIQLSAACFSCHEQNFNEVMDPNHNSNNFDHNCLLCHTTNAWEPANWDHDTQYFPIYSGEHREEWNACSDCHLSPSNYSQFECINCHEHNREEMDNKHDEEQGYEYLSIRCYECHPDGRED